MRAYYTTMCAVCHADWTLAKPAPVRLCSPLYCKLISARIACKGKSNRQSATGPSSGSARVLRGGSWNNNAQNCAVSYRNNNSPENRNNNCGFRVARSSSKRKRRRIFP
ncbi:MAG: SUMF1/EgtB/PvdO family nonheme iron enzyme [Treponema sp.]|nr:SUMF1/EgtB/PvdO family nonheme iron enzyme [Treponema sp.]